MEGITCPLRGTSGSQACNDACPAAEAKPSLRDVTSAKSQGTARQLLSKGSQGLKPVLRAEKHGELPAPRVWRVPMLTEGDKLMHNPLCQAEQHLHISHSSSGSRGAGPAWHQLCQGEQDKNPESAQRVPVRAISWHPSSVTLSPRHSTMAGAERHCLGATFLLYSRLPSRRSVTIVLL